MEDVSDAPFRRVCRGANSGGGSSPRMSGAGPVLCVTEFVAADQIVADSRSARRRIELASDDRPTAIQIYGASRELLVRAAVIAERSQPAFLDINCGCWVPRIANRGAGAGWLRDPTAMVAMAREIVAAVAVPVTVKTRIGWGPESHMPIVDLARRLEDVGIAGIFVHCRTAQMGHAGEADWSWARRAREAVAIPVVVNGDVRTASDVVRALTDTGCAGAMIGRAAIDHPWVFREARAALGGAEVVGPTPAERIAVYRGFVVANAAARGPTTGIGMTRRHVGVLGPLAAALRPTLFRATTLGETLAILDEFTATAAA